MQIDWLNYTPWSAWLGGALIGLAVAWLMLFNGRIAGISGITGGLFTAPRSDRAWRYAFLLGLMLSPWVYRIAMPFPAIQITHHFLVLVLAGGLVGFGSRLGSGCTSGHGVCGLSRGAKRSFVATSVFMGVAFAVVFVVRHVGRVTQ